MNYAFINGVVWIFTPDGDTVEVPPDHLNYTSIIDAVKENKIEAALELSKQSISQAINSKYRKEGVVVDEKSNKLFINGEEQNDHIRERIKENIASGLPFEHLTNFLNKLEKNPSNQSREDLFKFLEAEHIPISEDGYILGYKSVRADFKDWHSGKFDNRVGQVVKMPRCDVDSNSGISCGKGLHVGNYKYVKAFHEHCDRQMIMVKVHPKNVVSVPNHDCNKFRCCEYEVIALCKEKLEGSVYSKNLSEMGVKYNESQWEDDEFWE